MRPLVTSEEMRRADQAAVSSGERVEVLMERAGRAVARAVLREAGGRYGRRVTVVCGKGNNGGDGFVVARVLHQEGLRVLCCTTFDASEAKGAAAHHLALLRASGCRVVPFDERHLRTDVIVDAVFGTGFRGGVEGEPGRALAAIEHVVRGEDVVHDDDAADAIPGVWPRPRVVSVDVPSAGVVPADLSVALAAEKVETFFAEPDEASHVEVADIGIPVHDARVYVVDRADVEYQLPRLQPDDHKTSHGSVVIIAGSDATTGAAVLSARAAARMGAGYVTLVSTRRVIEVANLRLPEVLKTEQDGSVLTGGVLENAAEPLRRTDAVALGPGLGTGPEQSALVERCLTEIDKPLVLDADALNALAGRAKSIAQRVPPTVITPHVAEMARLLEIDISEVSRDRSGVALRAAEELGCTVVLKGRNTLVASPSGGVSVTPDASGAERARRRGSATAWAVPAGGPELATAGTGDVLTGAVAATMARGVPPHEGVAMTCFVHGVAGAIAAERSGPSGVVAWDVAEALPAAVESVRAPYAGRR